MKNTISWINKKGMHQDVSHNISISMLCTFIQLVTRFFVPPIILKYVSIEEYGIWAYCFIFVNYFGMSVLGITNVYVRYSAVYHVNNEVDKINRLISTGVICAGSISVFVILCTWFFLPYSFPILQIPPNLYQMAFFMIFGTIGIFSLELSIGFFNYLLHGLQKVGLQRMILTSTHFAETILIISFLYFGFGIYSLLYAFIIRILLSIMLSGIACHAYLPGLSVRPKYFDLSMVRLFYGYGGIIQIRSMIAIVNRSMEKLLAGIFIGTQATALFDLGEKLPQTVISIPSTANAVFLPMSSSLHAKGEKEGIKNMYLGGCRYISIITGLFMGFLPPFSFVIMTAWLGTDPRFQTAALILTCFSLPYHVEVVTGPASAVFRSIKKPGIELVYGLSELILVLSSVVISFYLFGPKIIAIIFSVCTAIIAAAVCYITYTNRYFGIGQLAFFKRVAIPGIMPYIIAGLISITTLQIFDNILTDRWTAFYTLASSWVIYVVTVPMIIYFLILEDFERTHILECYFRKIRNVFCRKKRAPIPAKQLDLAIIESVWNNISSTVVQEPQIPINILHKKISRKNSEKE